MEEIIRWVLSTKKIFANLVQIPLGCIAIKIWYEFAEAITHERDEI